jgi:hypothetical protein
MILPSLSFIYLFLRGWLDASASEVQGIAYPFIYLFIYLPLEGLILSASGRSVPALFIYLFICPRSWEAGLASLILPHLSFIYLFIRGWPGASCMGMTGIRLLIYLFIYHLPPDATILAASAVARPLHLFIYLFPRPWEPSHARPPPVDKPL